MRAKRKPLPMPTEATCIHMLNTGSIDESLSDIKHCVEGASDILWFIAQEGIQGENAENHCQMISNGLALALMYAGDSLQYNRAVLEKIAGKEADHASKS